MTSNKPKIAVHRYKERPDDMRSPWLYTPRASHVPPGHHGEALIRMSCYETLQAECEKLVQSLEECVGWLEWMYHPQTSDKVDKARIQRANRALAPFRNKESK